MRILTTSDIKKKPARIFEDTETPCVLMRRKTPSAVCFPLAEGEAPARLIEAVERARAMLALERMRTLAFERGVSTLTEEEIEAEIGKARNGE